MRSDPTIRAGAVALIGGAVAFLGVFSFLAARFDYPEVLDGSAADVLPKLLATVIAAVFTGLNSYLGNYLGEFLGELSFSLFFLLSALAMLAPTAGFPHWMGYLGAATAVAGLVGMFRNVTDVVDPVAEVNNYLLPLWMIVFGAGLLRYGRAVRPTASAPGA
jgi:hypothetical protein